LQTSSLCECLGYESADLEECVRMLHDLYLSRRAASFRAVRDKYKQNKVIVLTFSLSFVIVNSYYCKLIDLKSCLEQFKCVANLPSPPEVPNHYFEEE
jgi:cyclin A